MFNLFQRKFLATSCVLNCDKYFNTPVNINFVMNIAPCEKTVNGQLYYVIEFLMSINEENYQMFNWFYFSEKNRDADYNKIMKRFSF